MQHLVPHGGLDIGPQRDVRADLSDPLASPSILLDCKYGVAATRRWAANNIQPLLDARHEQEFYTILPPPPNLEADKSDSDDSASADYATPGARRRRRICHKSKESEFSQVMPLERPWQWCGRGKRRQLNCIRVNWGCKGPKLVARE